ncbi:hypothetical protein [uncultured Roseibium sp.]|uniref:hypothetical protein n=1 Tax=uncultured Roseibium sp. TaxID=1936171 RepID=UPI002611A22E|nr:hypothetical protein [uncultured Roseibium sp.]
MKHSINRRTMLTIVAGASLCANLQVTAARTRTIDGTLRYRDKKIIPKGQVEVFLKGSDANADPDTVKTLLTSDGSSQYITFSLELPAGTQISKVSQIVARLEREDGWLLARGSASLTVQTPVNITLNTVMY